MPVLWEIDPVSEDATNVPLSLVDSTFRLTEMDLTPPEVEPIFAASADTEGDPYIGSRHRNRTIALSFIAMSTTNALVQTAVYGVQQKVDKLRREGGTLKMTTQAGTTVVGDVLFARFKPEFTPEMYVLNRAIRFTLEFECKPYFRGDPVQQADHTETSLPCLVFTDTTLAGDVWGLGKLVIDEDQAADQWWLTWGIQSRYYDSASSAALFYEAESRTPLGGSAIAAGPSGASGSGSNVMRNLVLTTSYQAILSTQAVSAGAHLSHVGNFRVYARVQVPATNTGAVALALEWGEGDFHVVTRNTAVTFPVNDWDATWRLVDLGQVHLTAVAQGTQRWEGRILAKSTVAGDDVDIDWLMLVPTDEGSGVVSGLWSATAITSITARDEFDQAAGAITGKTLPVGGTWAGAGDADDADIAFTADSRTVISRTAVSDASSDTGRYLIAGSTTFTDVVVQVDATRDVGTSAWTGVLARYIDTSNWFRAVVQATALNQWNLRIDKRVAGTVTLLTVPLLSGFSFGSWYTVRLVADALGNWAAWVVREGGAMGSPTAQGQDAVLATAGALASGKSGIYDSQSSAVAVTRNYDNFLTGPAPPRDAAVFASQSLELRHDRVIRENSAGTIWTPVSSYEGDYLKVPPAGKESRTVRCIVKASRNVPGFGADSGTDDLSGRLTYTPRYLVLPA